MVRSPGFEPGIISLEGLLTANDDFEQFKVLNQTRRRPQIHFSNEDYLSVDKYFDFTWLLDHV